MAKKAMIAKQKRPQKFKVVNITAAKFVVDQEHICGNSECRICFRELAHKGELPE